jgi:Secretion system C-terminal sorting domain/SprB repeat
MKTKNFIQAALISLMLTVSIAPAFSQACSTLVLSSVPYESRCMSTGYITVTASGGSGSYNYKATGPVTTSYTSSNVITGLSAGNYTVTVKDIVSGCVKDQFNVIVSGTYVDPRFSLIKTDETCLNSGNGTVTVTGQTGGRAPFSYTIVAPSPFGVGTTNGTGVFTGLKGGEYAIQLRDSCGGIQTRRVTVNAYDWWIDNLTGNRNNCTNADFSFTLRDNRGNTNTSGSVFSAFTYGVVRSVGDTQWFASRNFTFDIQTRRSLTLVAKDGCGNVKSTNWNVNPVPGVAGAASTSQQSCNSFSASITGQSGLTNPQYTLFTSANVLVSTNTNGSFSGFPAGSYYINIRDNCFDTTIRRNFTVSQPVPFLNPSVSTNRTGCKTFDATATGLTNFTSPTFRLYNSANTLLVTQASATFTNLTNGSYSIQVQDACTGTILTRNFTVNDLVPSINTNVTISNAGCADVTVSINGQTNLNNPQYCLYNSSNVLMSCNTTGTFNNVVYGNYTMRITNSAACYDTTIVRTITINKSTPSVAPSLTVTRSCNTVNLSIGGQANLTNAQYCLFDGNNVQVACNTTGVFNNMPYGTYCMDIRNDAACYDTVIRRCVTVNKNIPAIGTVNLSSTFCSGFTATVASQNNLSNPSFQLKNSLGIVISTNGTGIFTNLAYGSYSIEMQNDVACYDTLIVRNFSATRPAPNAGSVTVNGQTCTTFNADFTGEVNVTSPLYYLVNSVGDTIANNGSGTFNNIAFGSYCIHMRDNCYDTSIIRCFTGNPIAVNTTITAQASCVINSTDIRIQFTSGFAPYTVNVFDPFNALVGTVTTSSNPAWVTGLPALAPGLRYRVVASDNCGGTTTTMVSPIISAFNKSANIIAKCPSGTYQNGSSNLVTTVTSTLGTVYPLIIKKNASAVSMGYTTQVGNTFTWVDLEPATYVVMYDLPGSCSNMVYDTLTVTPYNFPALNNSAAYQCDNNDFSVGASISGGSAPYSYQVIGSVPSLPSIVTAPQASPVFAVTNGQIYSLIRLRAIDACGNATLNDVSILPLANVVVSSSSACYYNSVTLTVDSVSNASYTWFKKTSATDSVEVGNTQSFNIPYLLPTDTGTYVAKVTVNSGCMTKLTYYNLTTACGLILPAKEVTLTGKKLETAAELNWSAKEEKGVKEYIIERSSTKDGQYKSVGTVNAKNNNAPSNYYIFQDSRPESGMNYYRLRIVDENGKSAYSNIVMLSWTSKGVRFYPNPAKDVLNIEVSSAMNQDIKFTLYNVSGQLMQEKTVKNIQHGVVQFQRQQMKPGMYLVKMTDLKTGEVNTEKILFQ